MAGRGLTSTWKSATEVPKKKEAKRNARRVEMAEERRPPRNRNSRRRANRAAPVKERKTADVAARAVGMTLLEGNHRWGTHGETSTPQTATNKETAFLAW